jgi:hypothetical protein
MKRRLFGGEHGEFRVMLPMYRIRHVAVTVSCGSRQPLPFQTARASLIGRAGFFCVWGVL